MYKKKWLVIVLLVITISLFGLTVLLSDYGYNYVGDYLTAGASASQGSSSLCINHPPTITTIPDQSATAGTAFSLTVTASAEDAGQTLTYSDDTSLFNIDQNGLISFTPTSGQVGSHTIVITVSDGLCSNSEITDTFILTVAAAPETPSGGAVSGGGAAGAGVAAPTVEHLPFNPVSDGEEIGFATEEMRVTVGKKYQFMFGEIKHHLQVMEINHDNLVLEIASPSPQIVRLAIDEEAQVDVDEDFIEDLWIKLLAIQGKTAVLLTQSLHKGFTVSDSLLKVAVRESQLLEKEVVITNDWGNSLDLAVTNSLKPLTIVPIEFTLHKDQRDVIKLTFNPGKNAAPDVYNGIITILGRDAFQTFTKQIPIVLEVTSSEYLFDTSLDLLRKSLLPNEELQLAITIFNPRRIAIPDVKIIYAISDFKNAGILEFTG